MSQLVKKHKIAVFLQKAEAYTRIKKGTALTLSMNPVEEEFDYIADESATTEVTDYKPSIDQDLVMYKGEEDYEMIFDYLYNLKTGSDAHTKCMIVFMQEPLDAEGNPIAVGSDTAVAGYKAWETDSVLSMQDLNAVDKKINFKVLFGGGITKGTAKMTSGTPTFTAES